MNLVTAECSSSEKGDCESKVIKLDPHINDRGTRVITDDGEKTPQQFLDDERMDAVTKDTGEVRRTYLDDMNRDKKQRRHQKRIFGTSERPPLVDRKASYEESSYVRHLTPEDLKLEQIQEIREQHLKEYGAMIDENIVDLVKQYLKIENKSTNPLEKTQLMECALLALTKGPADLDGLIHRLDTALEQSTGKIKFTFDGKKKTFKETLRRIVKADPDSYWMRKYLVVDGNGSFATSKYQFPPLMMKIAAQFPDKMRLGWSVKLRKDDTPYTEEQLNKDLPELKAMINFDDIPHHKDANLPPKDGGLTHEQKTRRHDNESNRRSRYTEIKNRWLNLDDISKAELYVGIMQTEDCIIDRPVGWAEKMLSFMNTNKNPNANFKAVASTDLNTINREKLEDPKRAISKLVISRQKNMQTTEYGLIPDAAAIPWVDLCEMLTIKKEGFKLLDEYCKKNVHIGLHVDPDKYGKKPEETKGPDTPATEEASDENAFQITGGEEVSTDLENMLIGMITSASDETIATFVKKHVPKIANILTQLKIEINMKISM